MLIPFKGSIWCQIKERKLYCASPICGNFNHNQYCFASNYFKNSSNYFFQKLAVLFCLNCE
jgi:hypothetical protein